MQTSIFDLKQLEFLISFQLKNDKKDNSNKLLDIVINNSEHLKNFYKMENVKKFFESTIFVMDCQKNELII